MPRRLLVLLLLQTLLPQLATADGVQTNFGDISFAGGMTWEPLQDLLYLTGQVGKNGCWVGILQRSTMKFLSKVVLPEPSVCQTLLLPSQSEKTALLLATTEEGGLFTNTRVTGSKKATEYGLVVPVQWQDAQASSAKLPTGLLLHEDPVQYPLAILQDPQRRDLVFVASLHSASTTVTDDYNQESAGTPNLTPSGVFKHGSQYFLHLERIQYNLMGDKQLTATWRKPFGLGPTDVTEAYSVHFASMIWNRGTIVVAGSTRGGGGLIYGTAQPQAGNVTSYTHAYCMNGFVSKLDPTTGQPWKSTKGVQRYSLGSDKDTFIEAICSSDKDATDIYITGRYVVLSGNSAKSIPYLAKLDATTLETKWHHDLVFSQNAFGLACGVGSDGVYMAGIVESGGSYGAGETTSLGLDDIFVVKLQIADGHSDWIRQVGTQGNDRLAHGGSGLLVVNDGIVLFGDTTGNLRGINHKGTEVFVVEMDTKGAVSWTTTETSGNENNGGTIQIQVAKRMDATAETDSGTNGRPLTPTKSQESAMEKTGTGGGIVLILTILLLGVVAVIVYRRRSRKREIVTERAVVFSYLHAFDLEDVDVRHSATGGWHGTYVGNLALGRGQGTTGRLSSSGGAGSRLSHSSIVKDSLFVDYPTTTKASSSSPYGDDYQSNFRIGEHDSDDEIDDDEKDHHDPDPDFEAISRLEERLAKEQQQQGDNDGNKPWGRDII